MTSRISGASFRDPSGFVFFRHGQPYRQVSLAYREEYEFFVESGLFEHLTSRTLLLPHEEVSISLALTPGAYRVLRPQLIPFVSYPYEWSVPQLRDAALLTLEVQKRALDHGMILKDASAFNIQFRGCQPVFIDTLSFERYVEGQPWVAYRQFCQHFLAPLALMSRIDPRLGNQLATHLDGIPLDLASKLLPGATWLRPSHFLHLHLHARSIAHFGGRRVPARKLERGMSRRSMDGLVSNLESAVRRLPWKQGRSEWATYEDDHAYERAGFEEKKRRVTEFLDYLGAGTVWDLGSNTGVFSRLAAQRGNLVVSIDADPDAVALNYRAGVQRGEKRVLPLLMDLANPSPSLGWNHSERSSLRDRGPADALLALAVLHHLVIGNNTPFPIMAEWLASLGRYLIVEFVPKEDPQTQRLLVSRKDIFTGYSKGAFEACFTRHFEILKQHEIEGTDRILYLMRSRADLPARTETDSG